MQDHTVSRYLRYRLFSSGLLPVSHTLVLESGDGGVQFNEELLHLALDQQGIEACEFLVDAIAAALERLVVHHLFEVDAG